MDKSTVGATIGVLVGGGPGFLVGTILFASSGNVDMANYAAIYGLTPSLLAAFGGAMIGSIVGAIVEYVEDIRLERETRSKHRVCLYCGLKTNPGWRERCQICGKPLERATSQPPQCTHHPPQ